MTLREPDLRVARGGRVISSSLYDSTDPAFLTQDLLLVALADGTYIDVGWAPEHDPSGSYYVTVFRGPRELDSVTCETPSQAVSAVERFAAEYAAADHAGSTRYIGE